MGKKRALERKLQNQRSLESIQTLAKLRGVELKVLNAYPMHLRLTGHRIIDYWPSTRRAWVYGSQHRSAGYADPQDVVNLALQEPLPEGALDHLQSIGRDIPADSRGPASDQTPPDEPGAGEAGFPQA